MQTRKPVVPRRAFATLIVLSTLAAGCARTAGPPAIRVGSVCATCGMEVHDLSFVCERTVAGTWRVYDAIECMIRDAVADSAAAPEATRVAWLADYDRQSLHPADSVWVVQGSFPSPMGGGYAAFLSRAAADSIAATTQGRVERLSAWLAHPAAAPDPSPAEPAEASK